ncbi:MAG TPA: fibronectin type III domain-containing protein [Gaiellaceae bacterium]|nr:fibronectin type III domain-containing protein [Gaiellaceae bacterium]
MLRRSAALILLALSAVCALASSGANATRNVGPEVISVETHPFSAVVRWRIPDAGRVVLEVGVDDRYGIWSPTTVAHAALHSRTTLAGLEPATTYRFRVVTRGRNGLTSEARGSFQTSPWPGSTAATAVPLAAEAKQTAGAGSPFVLPPSVPPGVTPTPPGQPTSSLPAGTPTLENSSPLRINGNAVFPRMVWRQCPAYYPTSLGAGINLFLGVSCDGPSEQFARLAGRAMSTVDAKTPGISGPGKVGWHLQDEADVSVGNAKSLPQPKGAGRVTFLTLTDKFSVNAAAGPYGKEIYPAFFESADVIGFDTYPVEVRCSLSFIDNVYWMQRELIGLTGGKPTFQWIEAGPMEHCRENEGPTPTVVRAETWLAIAGGARGIGYFPDWWAEDIRGEVRLTNREILALAPALLAPVAKVNWSTDGPVRVGARRYNGATYIIAANTSTSDATAAFSVPGLGGRKLRVFRDGRTVKPLGDLVTDKLPGLGVAVYVVPPGGW